MGGAARATCSRERLGASAKRDFAWWAAFSLDVSGYPRLTCSCRGSRVGCRHMLYVFTEHALQVEDLRVFPCGNCTCGDGRVPSETAIVQDVRHSETLDSGTSLSETRSLRRYRRRR